MFPYVSRLLWMSLASFFLVQLATGLAIWWMTPAILRAAKRMRAGSASRFLFAARLFPCAFAIFVVAGLCVPSYLCLEPEAAAEEMSIPCMAAAILGCAIWGVSIFRSLRALAKSRRYVQHCRAVGREIPIPEKPGTAWVMEGIGNCVGLAGIFRPQVVIRSEVISALSREELEAVLRHEWAHWASRDNLRCLVMLVTPDMFPFLRGGFPALEKAWTTATEWAADDRAVEDDSRRSLSLAAALVRVARISVAARPMPLLTSLVGDTRELSVRVDRLLDTTPESGKSGWTKPVVSAAVAVAICIGAMALRPSTLYAVHRLLENLVR